MFVFNRIIIGPLYRAETFCILFVVKVFVRRARVEILDFSFLLISCLSSVLSDLKHEAKLSVLNPVKHMLRVF